MDTEEFDRALLLRDSGDLAGAFDAFEQLRVKFPQDASVHGMQGGIARDLGMLHEAVALFKRATELAPVSEVASAGLFYSLFDMGHRDEAFSELRRYLSLVKIEKTRVYSILLRDFSNLNEAENVLRGRLTIARGANKRKT